MKHSTSGLRAGSSSHEGAELQRCAWTLVRMRQWISTGDVWTLVRMVVDSSERKRRKISELTHLSRGLG